MNVHERAELLRTIFEDEIIPLGIEKGKGYGEKEDAFANLRVRGVTGVIIRMEDKVTRLGNLMDELFDLRGSPRVDLNPKKTLDSSDTDDDDPEPTDLSSFLVASRLLSSFEDNLKDVVNYALYALILAREALEK